MLCATSGEISSPGGLGLGSRPYVVRAVAKTVPVLNRRL